MRLAMQQADYAYTRDVLSTWEGVSGFLELLDRDAPELYFALVGRITEEFLSHLIRSPHGGLDGPLDPSEHEDYKRGFLSGVVCVLSGLYSMNDRRIPAGISDELLREAERNCDDMGVVDERRSRLWGLNTFNNEWIAFLDTRFCVHGQGPIYALAEAFVVAQESEEDLAKATQNREAAQEWAKKGISASVAQDLEDALGKEGV